MPGIVWTEGSNRIVRHYVPEGAAEPASGWFETQFPGSTLTKRTLASDQVLEGGEYPVGRVASASTTAATLSDLTLTTNQQNAINAGLRRREMREWLRSFYDSGYFELIEDNETQANGINNLLTMVATACSHDANLLSRWAFISDWTNYSAGDIIKNFNASSWSGITPQGSTGTQFHTFNENGTANAVSATFFMTGNANTLRNFVL